MIVGLLMLLAAEEPRSRAFVGDWYVSDSTDNNTGDREVYAFQSLITRENYVTLTMRCSKGRPTFFIDWDDVRFPAVAVVSIAPARAADNEPETERYVFDKSEDAVERGLRASPETTKKIVAAIGTAPSVVVTAHLSYGERTAVLDVTGTQQAWNRVVRHCPIAKVPTPPL